MSLVVIAPPADRPGDGARLEGVLAHALAGRDFITLRRAEELSNLAGKKILFALPLGEFGINLAYVRILERLRREPHPAGHRLRGKHRCTSVSRRGSTTSAG